MKFLLIFFSLLYLNHSTAPPSNQFTEELKSDEQYVVLISIDGFRPDFYLDLSWPAPMLQHMASEGAHAIKMKGVLPSLTYPSHTTMVTGVNPGKHGILFNSRFPDGSYYFEYNSIRSETVWDAAKASGLKTANVGWPVTLHAPFDYNIPISGALQNSGIADDPIRTFTTPEGYFDGIELEATGRIRPGDLSNSNPSKENRVAEMVAYIVQKEQPNLLTVALQHTDSMQHRHGREHFMVRRAVSAADRAIARIVEAYDAAGILEKTTFIVGGDHDFSDIHTEIAPNILLKNAGINTNMNDSNWQANFATAGGSAFLYINQDANLDENYFHEIMKNVPGNIQRYFSVLSKTDLNQIQSNPDAALALSAADGFAFSSRTNGDILSVSSRAATHGHLSDFDNMMIGFVAWGRGIKSGTTLPLIDLMDVAPTVANLLNLELQSADGLPLKGILENQN